MEALLIALAPQLLPVVAVLLVSLATWGIAILKKKTDSEIARNALGQVDSIVGAVVGRISQTTADVLKASAADGKLTDAQKSELKKIAVTQINGLLTTEVSAAAAKTVTDLQGYISQKIEQQVHEQPHTLTAVIGQAETVLAQKK